MAIDVTEAVTRKLYEFLSSGPLADLDESNLKEVAAHLASLLNAKLEVDEDEELYNFEYEAPFRHAYAVVRFPLGRVVKGWTFI